MLPAAFDAGPVLPVSPSGMGYVGLPIVDGVTITHDLLTAVRIGLVDVPLIVQTMLAESDTLSASALIYNMSPAEYHRYLEEYFALRGWSSGAGDRVFSLYAEQAEVAVELAYQQFSAEFSFLCGNVQVALAAAEGFKSPVYSSVVAHAPGNPLVVSNFSPPSKFAGHLWDYMMATGAWDYFSSCTYTLPVYQPTSGDILLGQSLMQQWQNLTVFHNLDAFGESMLPVDSVPGFPSAYNMVVQNGTGPAMVLSYAADRCATLAASPLSLNQSFWVTN